MIFWQMPKSGMQVEFEVIFLWHKFNLHVISIRDNQKAQLCGAFFPIKKASIYYVVSLLSGMCLRKGCTVIFSHVFGKKKKKKPYTIITLNSQGHLRHVY